MQAAFEGRARAAENERKLMLWQARETALLNAYAYHNPKKMPSMAVLLGEEAKPQTARDQMSFLKSLTAKVGGAFQRNAKRAE